jgi:hypothetical protein
VGIKREEGVVVVEVEGRTTAAHPRHVRAHAGEDDNSGTWRASPLKGVRAQLGKENGPDGLG